MSNGSAPHVVVAGAGVTGLTCALELARAGARVTLCDPAPLGDNASGVAAGMIAPVSETVLDKLDDDAFALLIAARDLWPDLAARTHIVLDRSGSMIVGPLVHDPGVGERLRALGVPYAYAPGGRDGSAIAFEGDWLLEPGAALEALRQAGDALAVTSLSGAITGYRHVADGLAIDIADDGDIRCDRLVLATGAQTAFAPELAHLTPIKGHILRFPALLPPGPVLRGEGVYLCPTEGGLTVGATMEFGAADRAIDPGRVSALRAAGARLLPAVATTEADVQVGIRAATPDGLPLVGPSATPGVILAAGLRRNGWLLAPLVAKVVAAYALDRDPGPHAAAFDPRRFDTSD